MIGVASGAYSSIFIASPVLTHWKEREPQYRARRQRILSEYGVVAAYATAPGSDIEPTVKPPRRVGRLTQPEAETVSAAEFEEMKRDIAEEEAEQPRRTSTLTKRLSHTRDSGAGVPTQRAPRPKPAPAPAPAPQPEPTVTDVEPAGSGGDGDGDGFQRAPDVAENEGVSPVQKPKPVAKSRTRSRRHGRRR
jgi:SecD/SecF fusion protein